MVRSFGKKHLQWKVGHGCGRAGWLHARAFNGAAAPGGNDAAGSQGVVIADPRTDLRARVHASVGVGGDGGSAVRVGERLPRWPSGARSSGRSSAGMGRWADPSCDCATRTSHIAQPIVLDARGDRRGRRRPPSNEVPSQGPTRHPGQTRSCTSSSSTVLRQP
jgi:hypothetical protein